MGILNLNGAFNFNKLVEKALEGNDYSTISSYNRDHVDGPLKLLTAIVLLLVLAKIVILVLGKKDSGPEYNRGGRGRDNNFGNLHQNNRGRSGNYRR